MSKYLKLPVFVEAFQMTEERRLDNSKWPEWLDEARCQAFNQDDWIVNHVDGSLSVYCPDVFEKMYEAVRYRSEVKTGFVRSFLIGFGITGFIVIVGVVFCIGVGTLVNEFSHVATPGSVLREDGYCEDGYRGTFAIVYDSENHLPDGYHKNWVWSPWFRMYKYNIDRIYIHKDREEASSFTPEFVKMATRASWEHELPCVVWIDGETVAWVRPFPDDKAGLQAMVEEITEGGK